MGNDAMTEAEAVALDYFKAAAAGDAQAMGSYWAADGVDHIYGFADLEGPAGVTAYFTDLFNAFPDFNFEVLSTTAEDESCAVRWAMEGTFAGPGSFQGVQPTGSRVSLEGVDVLTVRGGKIVENRAYTDGAEFARQIGAMPAAGSKAEERLTGLANFRTKVSMKLGGTDAEPVADGVWLVRGGFPSKTMNVYLIETGDGVVVFDAGIKAMTKSVAAAAARLGGIDRVVLGHAHADHRGIAPGLGADVYCHPADKADAESDGGAHYFHIDKLDLPARWLMPKLLTHWDGGPVEIKGTVEEGDDVAGFKVVHLPGHAPGLIGLWRESDRLALVSDCFYTLDPQTGHKGHARVPHSAFNQDTEVARQSILKLAAMEPAAAWAGHADPVTGDVKSILETAARET
jgi:glyoxylase-like metal-dependent hydrolase (beta-lactamase superfamily II)/predicted ester cyclase